MRTATASPSIASIVATSHPAAARTTREKLLADPKVTLLLTRRARQNLGGVYVVDRRIDLYHCREAGKRDSWIKVSYVTGYPHMEIPVTKGSPEEIETFHSEAEARARWRFNVNEDSWAGMAYPSALAEHEDAVERRARARRTEAEAGAEVAS